MFNKAHLLTIFSALTVWLALPTQAADLLLVPRVQVSTNNANFDLSVFPGQAGYNDRGIGGAEPGAPTFRNTFGNGTVLDYNFVGNDGTGSALTTYADGGAGLIPTPTAPAANVHGSGEEWSNVWTTNDPGPDIDFSGSVKNHNPTGVVGAANTFARAAEVDGTIDISSLSQGQVYFMHGTFINQWTLTLTMSGPGQPDIVALDTQDVNGVGTNFGWVTEFTFSAAGLYDTITYNYTNADRDGSRARFMGVILDGPEDLDGDGLSDIWEDQHFGDNSGTVEPSDLTVTDGTGDADGDGLTDQQEHDAGSDPNSADGDGDGLSDADEINIHGTDPALADTDGDGLNDDVEVAGPTDPLDADSDDDGLNDGDEATAGTDPNNPDSDGDGYNDGFEVANVASGFDPLVDDSSEDPDGDGLDNAAELVATTDPIVADTDGDGDNDGDEVNGLVNSYTGGVLGAPPGDATDPLNSDSDGDGVTDGDETDGANGSVTDPNNADTDGDGFDDGDEILLGSSPTDPGDFPSIVPPTASLTWDAAQDTGGDNFWPSVEFPASTVMRWAFSGPVTPTVGVSNFSAVTAWYNGASATMESFNDGEFNTTFSQPTNKPVTFELVFRPGDLVDNHLLFETGGNGDGLGIVINGDTLFFRAQDANSAAQRIIMSHTFTAGDEGDFHHIVGTIQPGAAGTNVGVLYVNGTQVDTFAATGNVNDWAGGDNSGLGVLTGSTPTGQTGFAPFTGDIAGLRFWANTILTGPEVGAIYDSISVPPADDDGDGLPDPWEILHFGDITLEDGTGNGDSDGLTNLEELNAGTDPTVADTDGDGTNDGDEVNGLANPYTGGVLGVAPGDSTDPLNPDSDNDGISDGDETDNANGSVSDPNNPDTDGDGFKDGIEVNNASDPTDPGDTPPITLVTVRGTGTAALRGGDLTDPENDGVEVAPPADPADWAASGWNWADITASSEANFSNLGGGNEAAFDVFDNTVGGGSAKWCCNAAPQSVTVQFAGPVALDSFTVTSSNDTPARDPRVWGIYGSNDGINFSPIYERNDPALSLWAELGGDARNQVLEFTLPTPAPPYTYIRYDVTATGSATQHALNEIEYFGFVDNTDTDGDGLPDWYEDARAFLDSNNPADAALDQDGDGLDNLAEFNGGTDPDNTDTDGDGLSDGDEVALGTNPLVTDTDGDGFDDGLEVAQGSNPDDPFSTPTLNPITWGPALDITGQLTDLDLTGTLISAWNGGASTINVAGIAFVANNALGNVAGTEDTFDAVGSDPNYDDLLDEFTWNGATLGSYLEIPGLTPGEDYQIQIWTSDLRAASAGRVRTFTTDPNFGDANQFVDLESGDAGFGVPPQMAIGTFTAAASSQLILATDISNAGPQFNAIMVRQTSAVAPALVLTSIAQTGPNTFELSWTGGDGTNDIEGSADGINFNNVATGVSSPTTVVANPGVDPLQIFRIVEP